MTRKRSFTDRIGDICKRDPNYRREAYLFVQEALDFTVKGVGERRHVSGQELLEGIRRYAWQRFGRMAPTVFAEWGVRQTRDFGRIVFNMVDEGLMGKTDSDRIEDFQNGYPFETAFDEELSLGSSGDEPSSN
jgi:uncharacterized repeat protein (TIGR04138 family)